MESAGPAARPLVDNRRIQWSAVVVVAFGAKLNHLRSGGGLRREQACRLATRTISSLVQGALRALVKQNGYSAIGIAENVNITIPGQSATDAIKVLFKHQRGLTVGLYVPFSKKFLRGYVFGDMISMLAQPEVNAWPSSATA